MRIKGKKKTSSSNEVVFLRERRGHGPSNSSRKKRGHSGRRIEGSQNKSINKQKPVVITILSSDDERESDGSSNMCFVKSDLRVGGRINNKNFQLMKQNVIELEESSDSELIEAGTINPTKSIVTSELSDDQTEIISLNYHINGDKSSDGDKTNFETVPKNNLNSPQKNKANKPLTKNTCNPKEHQTPPLTMNSPKNLVRTTRRFSPMKSTEFRRLRYKKMDVSTPNGTTETAPNTTTTLLRNNSNASSTVGSSAVINDWGPELEKRNKMVVIPQFSVPINTSLYKVKLESDYIPNEKDEKFIPFEYSIGINDCSEPDITMESFGDLDNQGNYHENNTNKKSEETLLCSLSLDSQSTDTNNEEHDEVMDINSLNSNTGRLDNTKDYQAVKTCNRIATFSRKYGVQRLYDTLVKCDGTRGVSCIVGNCNFTSSTNTEMERHANLEHLGSYLEREGSQNIYFIQVIEDVQVFVCNFRGCDLNMKTQGRMSSHISTRHLDKRCCCQFENCSRKFHYIKQLTNHLNTKHFK